MKAFLLAGGRGERLHPMTLTRPKCLARINGTPLLAIWLDLCRRQRIHEVLLNVSHHADQVERFLVGAGSNPTVRLVVEREPLGSAGTVTANRDFVAGERDFWIFYADNLTDVALGPMLETHRQHSGVLTMGLFDAPDPRAAGIVELDPGGRIVDFVEKPERPKGDLASAGIFLARPALLDAIPARDGVIDFGHHVLPALVGEMYGHLLGDFLMDIGTPEALRRASEAWSAAAVTQARA